MNQIKVQATIKSPIETIWQAYTLPEHITKWNHANDHWQCPEAINDLKQYGKFSYKMAAKDGSFAFDFGGTYIEIVENKLIEYVLDDGRLVTNKFKDTPVGVVVTTTFDPEAENSIQMQKDGWQGILDNFKKYVESL